MPQWFDCHLQPSLMSSSERQWGKLAEKVTGCRDRSHPSRHPSNSCVHTTMAFTHLTDHLQPTPYPVYPPAVQDPCVPSPTPAAPLLHLPQLTQHPSWPTLPSPDLSELAPHHHTFLTDMAPLMYPCTLPNPGCISSPTLQQSLTCLLT